MRTLVLAGLGVYFLAVVVFVFAWSRLIECDCGDDDPVPGDDARDL